MDTPFEVPPVSQSNLADADVRLREMILYIARRSEGDKLFDEEKLTNLLFFADLEAYRRLGQTISGQDYLKLGDCPSEGEA